MSANQLQPIDAVQPVTADANPTSSGGAAKQVAADPAVVMFFIALGLVAVAAVVSIILALANDVQAAQRARMK